MIKGAAIFGDLLQNKVFLQATVSKAMLVRLS
jgi:hypothetical protein